MNGPSAHSGQDLQLNHQFSKREGEGNSFTVFWYSTWSV